MVTVPALIVFQKQDDHFITHYQNVVVNKALENMLANPTSDRMKNLLLHIQMLSVIVVTKRVITLANALIIQTLVAEDASNVGEVVAAVDEVVHIIYGFLTLRKHKILLRPPKSRPSPLLHLRPAMYSRRHLAFIFLVVLFIIASSQTFTVAPIVGYLTLAARLIVLTCVKCFRLWSHAQKQCLRRTELLRSALVVS